MNGRLTEEQWDKVSELFESVCELPLVSRKNFLDALNLDAVILAELNSLLASHDCSAGFLERSPATMVMKQQNYSPPNVEFSEGTQLGSFKIERLLGKGASASVYLAKDLALDRPVALKVKRLQGNEAKTMATLEHENIVRVFSESLDTENQLTYICMQYIHGSTLQTVIYTARVKAKLMSTGHDLLQIIDEQCKRDLPLNPFELSRREFVDTLDALELVCWYGAVLSEALGFAHSKAILHLDVKPANILVDHYGKPFIADFSISRNSARDASVFGGTEGYMAPEHRTAFETSDKNSIENIDARADVYSLGVVLKELLEACEVSTQTNSYRFLKKILDKCTSEKTQQRPTTGVELAKEFLHAFELRSIEKQLPPLQGPQALAQNYPILTVVLFAAVPQILGSVVNITYNSTTIIRRLGPEVVPAFQKLVLYYNAVLYPVCIAVFVVAILPLRNLDAAQSSPLFRKRILRLPLWISVISSLGWIPGAFLFPYFLESEGIALGSEIWAHFFISFSLSWLIALCYSVLFTQSITVRALYPRLIVAEKNPIAAAKTELASVTFRMRAMQVLTVFIPLAAASLIIFVGPESFLPEEYDHFRYLVVTILFLGVLGAFFANVTVHRTIRAVWTLMGDSSKRNR